MKSLYVVGCAASAMFFCGAAQAANLVANPGFETGTLSGSWTLTPASSGSDQVVGTPAHTGSYAWEAGATGGLDDHISQILTTTVNDQYLITYWLDTSTANDNQAGFYNVTSTFGGVTMQNLNPINPADPTQDFGYTEFSYTETASSTSTTLDFGIQALHGFIELDDVSVTDLGPVPSAGVPDQGVGLGVLAVTLLGLGLAARRPSLRAASAA